MNGYEAEWNKTREEVIAAEAEVILALRASITEAEMNIGLAKKSLTNPADERLIDALESLTEAVKLLASK